MPLRIPTVKELVDRAISLFETNLNQTVPSHEQAFIRVTSVVLGSLAAGHYKYAIERSLQAFIKTASSEGLDVWGIVYDLPRKQAEEAQLLLSQQGTFGSSVNVDNGYIGDSNGILYYPDDQYFVDATGIVNPIVKCVETGPAGNLNVGDSLTLESPVSGINSNAVVEEIIEVGVDVEDDEDYRQRLLDYQQTSPGGSNLADYRNWAQETPGVIRAYPYAGAPIGGTIVPTPIERSVFIEAEESIDPDGIPPQYLLDSARDYITYDPGNGETRQCLSCTDDTLYVLPITRTAFIVEVRGISIEPDKEFEAKQAIERDVDTYFRRISPFVDGLDPVIERNDTITNLTISTTVQKVLDAYGGTATGIGFGVQTGTFLPEYQLSQGEKAKLLRVDYV